MPSMTLTCRACNLPMHKSKTSRPQGKAVHRACLSIEHGSQGAYKGGCRCAECKDGHNARVLAYNTNLRIRNGKTPQSCTLCGDALACYTKTPRPFHKACKDKAPQWLKDGLPDPAIERAKRTAEADVQRALKAAMPKRDLRSDLRAGYEDGDYARFLIGLHAKVTATDDGCLEWNGRSNRGYAEIRLGKRFMQVHRMVIEARDGKPLGVLSAHHKCGNSICVSPEHLQPITQRENVAEMLARTSLEARIAELEAALRTLSPSHPVLRRISHLSAA